MYVYRFLKDCHSEYDREYYFTKRFNYIIPKKTIVTSTTIEVGTIASKIVKPKPINYDNTIYFQELHIGANNKLVKIGSIIEIKNKLKRKVYGKITAFQVNNVSNHANRIDYHGYGDIRYIREPQCVFGSEEAEDYPSVAIIDFSRIYEVFYCSVIVFFLLCHLIACLWYFIATIQTNIPYN